MKKFLICGLLLTSITALVSCEVFSKSEDELNFIFDDTVIEVAEEDYNSYLDSLYNMEELVLSKDINCEITEMIYPNTDMKYCKVLSLSDNEDSNLIDLLYSPSFIQDSLQASGLFVKYKIDESFKLEDTLIPDVISYFSDGKFDSIASEDDIKLFIENINNDKFDDSFYKIEDAIYQQIHLEGDILSIYVGGFL